MIGSIAIFCATAHAADPSGANLLGMGGVGAAASRDNAAISVSPGLIALHPRYDFGGLFAFGPDLGLRWGASAMDARTSDAVAAGFSYLGDRVEPELGPSDLPGWAEPDEELRNVRRSHEFVGAVGIPLFDRHLAIGFGPRVGLFDYDQGGDGWTFDLNAGIGVRPTKSVIIGLSALDVLPGLAGSDDGDFDRPLGLLAGVRGQLADLFSLEGNVDWRDQEAIGLPVTLSAGIEKPIDTARLRGGWRREAATGVHALTLGIGWEDGGAGLEYGVLVPLSQFALASTVHAVGIRFGAAPDDIPFE